jgi:NAD(P)-dependent dehydrogenase (short-subunit alcohol dehydrogenase family)
VKSNTIAPGARTRLTLATPGLEEVMKPKDGAFDPWDPANISPLVAYLASAECVFNGETFLVQGGQVTMIESWKRGAGVERDSKWTVTELAEALAPLAHS